MNSVEAYALIIFLALIGCGLVLAIGAAIDGIRDWIDPPAPPPWQYRIQRGYAWTGAYHAGGLTLVGALRRHRRAWVLLLATLAGRRRLARP